jgi:rubrerythrin
MNIFHVIEQLDTNSPEKHLEKAGRRALFRQLGDFGKKLAMGAIPFGAATVVGSQRAFAATETLVDVLNFALLLEYLESEFYQLGLDSGIIPGGDPQRIFMQIGKHEDQHVEFLRSAIGSLGGSPIDKPEFDFTAGGAFMPFGNYQQFLILAQAFEDTGVRAYKGQAGNLISNGDVLTAALQIHSVEARHAARVRRLRGEKGWITVNSPGAGMPDATRAVYRGEDQVVQAGINLTVVSTLHRHPITESFDEPLTREEVTAIASLFLA